MNESDTTAKVITASAHQIRSDFEGPRWGDTESGSALAATLTTSWFDVSDSCDGPKSVAGRILLAALDHVESVSPYGQEATDEAAGVLEEGWQLIAEIVCPHPDHAESVLNELDRMLDNGCLPRNGLKTDGPTRNRLTVGF